MKNYKRILFLMLCWLSCARLAYATYFYNFGIKEGLSQLSVLSIHQDALGRIWFGTLEGLSIYDGNRMISLKGGDYVFDHIIRNNDISHIVEDSAHNVYLNAGEAFIKYKLERDEFVRLRDDGVTSVTSISGHIYVSAKDSIFRWDDKEGKLRYVTSLGNKFVHIYSVYKDSDGTWWVASYQGLYKKEDGNSWECVIPDTYVWCIYESRSKELWIATNDGMYRIDRTEKITRFTHDPNNPNSLCCNQVRKILEDRNGNFWIGTFKGLNKYYPEENRFEVYVEGKELGKIRHSSIHSLMLDNHGNIWIGTYYGGVSVMTPDCELLDYYPSVPEKSGYLSFHLVGEIVEDSRNDLWICTDGGGLNFMDRETECFMTFNVERNRLPSNSLKSICYDSDRDRIYFAMYNGGVTSYDITRRQFFNCLEKKYDGYLHNNVRKVRMYKGRLLFLSEHGAFLMNPDDGKITPLLKQGGCHAMMVDSRDVLWVLCGYEVIRVDVGSGEVLGRYNLKDFHITYCTPLCICESADKHVYVGTQGAGILEYDEKTDDFHTYTSRRNGLLNNYCYSMANSPKGMLILLGNKGLSFFNTQTKRVDYAVTVDNLPIPAFNDGNGILVDKRGHIVTGSTDGIIILSEDEIQKSNKELSLYFSALTVNGDLIYPGDATGILNRIISYTKKITLNHRQNDISVTFANNNFNNRASMPMYEYKLEGFDDRWMRVNGNNRLTYTNLTPGNYTLRVREIEQYSDEKGKEIRLGINVLFPFYNTPLAWVIYVLSVVTIVYLILFERWRQLELRREKEQIEEMDKFKFNFFTDVSHELRTPLTLIITQAEMILNSKGLPPNLQNKMSKLHKNAFYMRNLLNELLDFHKLEQKRMRLNLSLMNVVPFLREIYSSFKEEAAAHGIKYSFVSLQEAVFCEIDPVQLRKVFFNLLSNAFKYTAEEGTVEMSVTEEENECVIRVIDSGIGIDKEDLKNIFKRFYRAENKKTIVGTGIGLALTKEIVALHQGTIQVESKVGYGSIFTVRLGMRKQEECVRIKEENEMAPPLISETENSETETDKCRPMEKIEGDDELTKDATRQAYDGEPSRHDYTLLIVEDDEELLSTLGELFSNVYRVLKARNGEEGWDIIQQERPDVILSDVMMPGISGIELCERIKNNVQTCHIPVILLTAAGSSEQQMKGLQTGADDYLIKPFSPDLLLLKISTILRNRNLREKRSCAADDFVLLAKSRQERQMLQKVEGVIEQNLANPDFNVDALAQELGMSKSSTFKKMKALIGITPADFILRYKLKKASVLLVEHPEFQVEDIALRLGFNSGRYFSKCFKDYFKVSPVQYRKRMIQNANS